MLCLWYDDFSSGSANSACIIGICINGLGMRRKAVVDVLAYTKTRYSNLLPSLIDIFQLSDMAKEGLGWGKTTGGLGDSVPQRGPGAESPRSWRIF